MPGKLQTPMYHVYGLHGEVQDLPLALGLDNDGAGGAVVDAALQLALVAVHHDAPRLGGLRGRGSGAVVRVMRGGSPWAAPDEADAAAAEGPTPGVASSPVQITAAACTAMSTAAPAVANEERSQWWSTPRKAFLPWNSYTGSASCCTIPASKGAYGTFQSRTVASVLAETHVSPSGANEMPFTAAVCPTSRRSTRSAGTSQMRISPSAAPAMMLFTSLGLRARQVTPSSCGSAAMKGFANTRSSLTALSARVYSCAFSNWCSSGS
ncbi:hypothetical protein TSOC_004886 [Tetrabaena socialis]|uniref:Uncharacterized protein n=1 Tax=Tetrabaena socialis TaxID=47790 RepID=A0A2J8A7T9_9CHLO|nr:hypothetical protein TSOC_004886 [Tetrabaena socialis]|eukprot:PNH08550.1 hypothetical protein TSOC_004886 [Tetrabaena socialis]